MGIRKKIMVGFTLLGVLLLFSGLVSYFELNRLHSASQGMLDKSMKNLTLSRGMLDAAQEQNAALLQLMSTGDSIYRDDLTAARLRLDSLMDAYMQEQANPLLDSVAAANQRYRVLVDSRLNENVYAGGNVLWFSEIYRGTYHELFRAIGNCMVSSQSLMEASVYQLERTARRAIMPGVIAVAIAILLIIVFAYFIDIYYIRPVTKMTSALKNFLTAKVPFHVKVEGRDEVAKLEEYIETLIEMLKNKKNE